jgi:transposase InsO family protein
MLSDKEFEELCLSLSWSREACELLSKIRSSEPARLVRGGRGNVRGRYPSRKMGCTIQFESHSCELPFIVDLEYYQEDVLEYWDQPATFRIEYDNKDSRAIVVNHTPDFLIIRKTYAEFVECKTEDDLVRLSTLQPGKYILGDDGQWRCPPGERLASRYGFRYRVLSDAEIDRVHYRNTIFLEDFLCDNVPDVATEQREMLLQMVRTAPGISLGELLERALSGGATADDVYTLIAKGDLYVDLRAEALPHRDRVCVYQDKDHAQPAAKTFQFQEPKGKFIEIREGARILWGDNILTILYVGESKIYLQSEKGAEPCITFTYFENLIRKGEIKGIHAEDAEDPDTRWRLLLNGAGEKRKREAMRRHKIVLACLSKEPLPEPVKPRTLARYKAAYVTAERIYGNGLVGLLPGWHLRGDRKTERIKPETRDLMRRIIEEEYETLVQKGMFMVWGKLVKRCEEGQLTPPSYVTFIRNIRKRPQFEQTVKRMGHRAAYAVKPFYLRLGPETPPHGDRPFEICHIDHTELDIELIDPKTGKNLGRPWATFLIDAFSRRILAVFLTFDPPSRASDMMAIRECVRRFNRLPQIIVVDGGADFKSVYFETLAAAFEITVKTRPPAEPRFGSVIERLFNTAHKQFVYNLLGNTQITRNVRQVTKHNDPKRQALWSLGELDVALRDWAYYRYDNQEHATLKQTPLEVYSSALRLTGNRSHRMISYDEEFRILTLPPTKKGKAKYFAGRGVKVNNEYYRCCEANEDELGGHTFSVRYDPFDYRAVYIHTGDRWMECRLNRDNELDGHSENERAIITAEHIQRHRQFNRGQKARAVERADKNYEDESRQREQKEKLEIILGREAENEKVRNVINANFGDGAKSGTSEDRGAVDEKVNVDSKGVEKGLYSRLDLNNLGSLEVYEDEKAK